MYTRIISTGKYLPKRVMTNDELETIVNTSDEWIRARTGIESRHIAAADEFTSHLAENAANLYYTDARVRAAVSAVDAGGDGSFSYNASNGQFTYTGPSASRPPILI